jgi:hypothetical protein
LIAFTLFDVNVRELSSAKSPVTLVRESAITFTYFTYITNEKDTRTGSLGTLPYKYPEKEKQVLTKTI